LPSTLDTVAGFLGISGGTPSEGVADLRRNQWPAWGGIRSEKGPFFLTTFARPFKDQSGAWHNGTSFGLSDLDALINVAFEAKEWMTAHALKR